MRIKIFLSLICITFAVLTYVISDFYFFNYGATYINIESTMMAIFVTLLYLLRFGIIAVQKNKSLTYLNIADLFLLTLFVLLMLIDSQIPNRATETTIKYPTSFDWKQNFFSIAIFLTFAISQILFITIIIVTIFKRNKPSAST